MDIYYHRISWRYELIGLIESCGKGIGNAGTYDNKSDLLLESGKCKESSNLSSF